jgi:hypothetical protein
MTLRARAPPTSSGDQTVEKSNATLTSSSPKEKEEKDRVPAPPSDPRSSKKKMIIVDKMICRL